MSDFRRILHFTDPHLFAGRDGEMRGVRTLDSLCATLATAQANNYPADAVLVTGDIAQDESRGAYRLFRDSLAAMGLPVYCLPGNHDAPQYMQEMLTQAPFQYCGTARFGDWLLVLLDTHTAGDAGGRISDAGLVALDEQLAANPDSHALLALHHHPVSAGSRWLDTVPLRNAADLWDIVDKHDNVRCLLWGHVHQAYDNRRDDIMLLSTPSTCRQFAANQDEFGLSDEPPAFRCVDLYDDGTIATAVIWCD
ncbi:MAG: metallophosphoesterase [Gammaproteobacteria bacterium]|nr:metallophosphoesterase [Gammaproteobacteria bacterium]NNF62425.1 3',5'-cyclic-AMP phosphodiesterase [Gammaproteobacteria bacterium]NNM20163.1 3',5'-cyclic-AMP phosphodiesterase [Gammaproteobacteria bacterium]